LKTRFAATANIKKLIISRSGVHPITFGRERGVKGIVDARHTFISFSSSDGRESPRAYAL
jgi:hypothetical protein